jgi:hypothetical protein
MKRSPNTPQISLTPALVAALLAACGGADMQPPASTAVANGTAQATAIAITEPVAPLLDDEGNAVPFPATTGDVAARAFAVASAAQAAMLTHGRPQGVVQVSIDERGNEAVERDGTLVARAPGAAGGFDEEAMVFVAAADLPRAEAVAQRLRAGGQARVWVVTQ